MDRRTPTSAKTISSSLGTAVATIFWVVATTLWWPEFSSEAVVALTGATAVILGFFFSYLTDERDAYIDYACKKKAEDEGQTQNHMASRT